MRSSLSTASGLAAIVLWSTTFAFARSTSEQLGPLTAGAVVYLIGGLFCIIRLALAGKPLTVLAELPRKYLFGCGLLFCFYTIAIYLAVGLARHRQQLLEVALLNYLWPSLTVLLSIPLLKQRANLWLLPGTVLAAAGVFLVMSQGTQLSLPSLWHHIRGNPACYALALSAALSWGLYSNLSRRWADPGKGGAVEWFIPFTGLLLLGLRGFVPESTIWNVRAIAESAALATVTVLAYVLWDLAMRRGNLILVAAYSYFTPLLSTVASSIYLGVTPGSRLWIGCILLAGGSGLTWYSVSQSEAPSVTKPH